MSYIANFSGVNPETMTRDFNAYIALTLDETLTIELRTKALLSYLNEISALLASANAILEDLKDIVQYEVDIIFQGWINDGTMSTIINAIITPIINNINAQVATNQGIINSVLQSQVVSLNSMNQIDSALQLQTDLLSSLLTSYQAIQETVNEVNDKHTTLTDTLNTALNTITLIQNRITSTENNLGTMQDQVNAFETRFNSMSTSFIDDLNALQQRVANATAELEVQMGAHTANVNQVINLYNNLNTALTNITSFADSARQFQQSIIQVINFIDQNQTTVNNNQTTITGILNTLDTLLNYVISYSQQNILINQLRNMPNFSASFIDTSTNDVLVKTVLNGTVTIRGIVNITSTSGFNPIFNDSDLANIPLNLLPNNVINFPCPMLTSQLNPNTVQLSGVQLLNNGNVNVGGVWQGTLGQLFIEIVIYVPVQGIVTAT